MKIVFKLREKFILVLVSAIFLAISFNTYFNTVDFIHLYKESVAERLSSELLKLKSTIDDVVMLNLGFESHQAIDKECQSLVADTSYAQYCFVIDKQGKIYYKSFSDKAGNLPVDLIVKTVLKSEEPVQYFRIPSGVRIYDYSLDFYSNPEGKRLGLEIHLGVGSRIIDEQVFRLIRRNIFSGVIFVFIASVLAFFIFRQTLLGPIKKLIGGISKFGRGDLNARVELKSSDEIAGLAQSFNSMAESIVGYVDNIKKAEAELKTAYERLKDTQAQLVQSSKMASLGLLAGGVAHEINSPLTGVLNNVQLIKSTFGEGKLSLEQSKDLLNVIEASALRCKKIVRSLLDFSHSSQDLYGPVSLNAISEKVTALIEHEFRSQGIAIRKDLQVDLPRVTGEDQLLQQVILDIISNAKWAIENKPKRDGGLITIKTEYKPDDKFVRILISDNGIGIPEENLEKIFEPFFTTKQVGEGTGLGLAIVYNIVKAHNGIIEAESKLGEGSTFKIFLPIYAARGNA
jgi:signal transduction histidine kinase